MKTLVIALLMFAVLAGCASTSGGKLPVPVDTLDKEKSELLMWVLKDNMVYDCVFVAVDDAKTKCFLHKRGTYVTFSNFVETGCETLPAPALLVPYISPALLK
jgi:hypothetical protein